MIVESFSSYDYYVWISSWKEKVEFNVQKRKPMYFLLGMHKTKMIYNSNKAYDWSIVMSVCYKPYYPLNRIPLRNTGFGMCEIVTSKKQYQRLYIKKQNDTYCYNLKKHHILTYYIKTIIAYCFHSC